MAKYQFQHGEKAFINALTRTITWCSRHASMERPETSLRVLSPKDIPHLWGPEYQVFRVDLERIRSLPRYQLGPLPPAMDLQSGRLLFCAPDFTDSSGVAKDASQGFFDIYDCPPSDTWIWYVNSYKSEDESLTFAFSPGYLVSWVPPVFLELAEKGIEACPMACIGWLDLYDDSFTQALQQLNLLS